MKILLASSNGIYDKSFKDTSKGQTGFRIMLRALAGMLPLFGDDVDVITHSNFTRGHKIGGSNLLKRTWLDVFLHTKVFYLKKAFYFCKHEKSSLRMKLRTLLYFMTGAYTEHLIKKNRYDVVHINGIGTSAVAYMYACARTNTPYVLTLHGLISFSDEVKASEFSKKLEREFFKFNRNNLQAISTVISTGIKNKLCGVVGADMDTINVICNPVIVSNDVSDGYVKPANEKVIVCVGNVSTRKNQRLVVDAFAEMCSKQKNSNYKLFIIGGCEEELKRYTIEKGINNVVFTGSIERGEVYSYYRIADLCIMASIDEGFGLSLVEGYSFGVPCVMPSAIDAFADLYDAACCIPANDYEIETFATAMEQALTKEWDKEKIKEFSKKFSEQECAKGYLSVLRKAAEFGVAPFDISSLDNLVSICFEK